MDLTLLIQAGPDGPIGIFDTPLKTADKLLADLQRGTPHTLRVLHVLRPNAAHRHQAGHHRIAGDWHHPAILNELQLGEPDDTARLLNQEHSDTVNAAERDRALHHLAYGGRTT